MNGEHKTSQDPHASQPTMMAGEPIHSARAAMLMLHGRGASAGDILSLASSLNLPGVTYLAPEAAGNTWYPYPFTASLDSNEPWLSSALGLVDRVFTGLILQAGIPPERDFLLGFSQGACLALE